MSERTLSAHPKFCTVAECSCPTDVVFLVVRDTHGRTRAGAASQFTFNAGRDGLQLRSGFEFDTWIARCTDHFQRELWATGKAQQNGLIDGHPERRTCLDPQSDGAHCCERLMHGNGRSAKENRERLAEEIANLQHQQTMPLPPGART